MRSPTVKAAYERERWKRMTPAQRAQRAERIRAYRLRKGEVVTPRGEVEKWEVAPAYVLHEREQRLAIPPRDLTAALLGDPLPGYSAADGRLT